MLESHYIYAVPPLIASLGNLFLGGLVLGKRPASRLNQVWALFSLCLAVWSFGFFMVYVNYGNKEAALIWNKIYSVGMVMIPIVYVHFVLTLIESKNRAYWIICRLGYLVSLLIIATIPTSLFNKDLSLLYWGYSPIRGISGSIYDTMYPLLILFGGYLLVKSLHASYGHKRAQIKYGIVASCIGFGFGLTNFFPLYGVRMYPIGHIGNLIANCLIAYTIMKYSFLDITVIIRKSAVYTVLTGMVTAAYIGVVFIAQSLFRSLTGFQSILTVLVVAMIVAITIEPMRRNIQLVVDKVFFRKSYEYQGVIKAASDRFRALTNPIEIASCLLQVFIDTLQPRKAWIMSYDKRSDRFLIVAANGLSTEAQVTFVIEKDSQLVGYMSQHMKTIWFNESKDFLLRRKVDNKTRRHLESLGLSIICPIHGKSELLGLLFLGDKKSGEIYTHNDAELMETICSQAAFSIENTKLYGDLQASYLNTVRSLVTALEAKDDYTKGHSERVARYAKAIALEMNLDNKDVQLLYEVSLLHDVGKIGVSEQILNKKTKLSASEFEHIQSHTITGEKILSTVESISEGLSAVRHHHERLNGEGYPDGLSESNIPLPARILAVADAYDAMTTKRPYRNAMTPKEAVEELKQHSCQQFDPAVVRAFISVLLHSDIAKDKEALSARLSSNKVRHLRSA